MYKYYPPETIYSMVIFPFTENFDFDFDRKMWSRLSLPVISSREGEQWLKMRRVLRQKMVKPSDVAIFSRGINEVISDLIKRIHILRNEEDGETVTDVNSLFFKYSMEGKSHHF